jgi:hypothetical protein
MIGEVPPDTPVFGRMKISGLVTLESGRHYNIFVGSDANADGNPNAIVRASSAGTPMKGPAMRASTCGSGASSP